MIFIEQKKIVLMYSNIFTLVLKTYIYIYIQMFYKHCCKPRWLNVYTDITDISIKMKKKSLLPSTLDKGIKYKFNCTWIKRNIFGS